MYPVRLNLVSRRCLVIGGGGVALRKIRGLLAESADLTVITAEAVAAIEDLAEAGRLKLEKRVFRSGDTDGFALVLAATDDREVNRQVFEEADAKGTWVNVADDPELCAFHLGGRVRMDPLEFFISSGGKAPFLVRRLRELLEQKMGSTWGQWATMASRLREGLRDAKVNPSDQEEVYDAFFCGTVDTHSLEVRVPSEEELASWIEGEGKAQSRKLLSRKSGHVSLVGAGPGDPGLLTARGRARLFSADAVVFDRLAAPALPVDLPTRVELHDVGKTAGRHPVTQDEINKLLVRLAREGKQVVRFKGGDPFVFARGSEEALVLVEEGISFDVVPGVTSGIAAAALAGIPVTHRAEAVQLTLVTAHESAKEGGPQVRWDLLAQDSHGTLVGYMGVSALTQVVETLIEHGMDPSMPAALVERGTTSAQRSLVTTLEQLPSEVQRQGLGPPALFYVGPSVRHAEALDWRACLPLAGTRIVTVSSLPGISAAFERAGAQVIHAPLPLTPAAEVVIGSLPVTGWILQQEEDVETVSSYRIGGEERSGETIAWCVGNRCAQLAEEKGWQRVMRLDQGMNPAEWVDAIQRSM